MIRVGIASGGSADAGHKANAACWDCLIMTVAPSPGGGIEWDRELDQLCARLGRGVLAVYSLD